MEHGHLDAMHALDEIDFEQGIMKDSEEHDQDTSHMMAESILDYEKRLDFLVSSVLAQSRSSKRDHYKDSLVYQARKDLISSFMQASLLKKCQRCSACVSASIFTIYH